MKFGCLSLLPGSNQPILLFVPAIAKNQLKRRHMIALLQVNRKRKRGAGHGRSANGGESDDRIQMLSTSGSNNNSLLTR